MLSLARRRRVDELCTTTTSFILRRKIIASVAFTLEGKEQMLLLGAHSKENMGVLVKTAGNEEDGCT